ncbi:MAG: MSMEG_4193 family putative phosphomutase [bacterium]|nr:MSMEG_4193 family putative phosphomutase [bacterium]
MTTILLIRHATNDFVKTGKLAGWTPEVHLNDEGKAQAEALGKRLAEAPLQVLYSSPLERTMQTAQAIQQHHPHLTIIPNTALGEVQYGDWQGMEISALQRRKMWEVVQEYPSRAYFPNGETMRGVQVRAVDEIERLVERHPRMMVAVVSHADLIKMVLAHYLGMHLDNFQRIVVSPASISVLQLGHSRPFVATMNDMAHVTQMEAERRKQQQAESSSGDTETASVGASPAQPQTEKQ